ncbi:MAG: proton-conducting transporter membrane subunit [bacterium]|nr:proton-conducting transporter membrane subunit [bacterium]
MHLMVVPAGSLIVAAASVAPWLHERTRHVISLIGGLMSAILGVVLAWPVLIGGPTLMTPGKFLVLDQLGAGMLVLVMTVYAASTVASWCYIRRERAQRIITERQTKLYYALLHLFVFTMVAGLLANNIAVLWIALEATTLSTTLLVAFRRTTGAVEAAWKYIMLCSTGITLGLLGVLMMSFAAQTSGAVHGGEAFLLTALREHAALFAPATVRWAFVFLFIGIGTKVGLAPMHTWLPDAHSKTPSPISALLSGVLLNVAFLVLLRFKFVADAALGSPDWTNQLFLVFGVLSIAIPALILLSQRNYKRMLGYSSVEHMGIMTFAVGLGPFGMVPALMHMAGHALAKPLLFLGAGEFLDIWKSTLVTDVRDAMTRVPRTATLFLLGLLALLAVPPSALFVSEVVLVGYGMTVHPAITLLVLGLLTITCIAMVRMVIPMCYAKERASGDAVAPSQRSVERWNAVHLVLALQCVGVVVLGCWFMSGQGFAFMTAMADAIMARV